MSQSHISSYPDELVHPKCSRCGTPMWLTLIEPDEAGFEKRTFECPVCQNDFIEIVKQP